MCQANPLERAEVVLPSCVPSFPYYLCRTVARRIESFALFPVEWLNLSALHSSNEDRLGDSFYDSYGNALQAREQFVIPMWAGFPVLKALRGDGSRLVDIAIAWNVGEDAVDGDRLKELLSELPPMVLVAEAKRRMPAATSPNAQISLLRMFLRYCIPHCRDLVRELVQGEINSDTMPDLLEVAFFVLPESTVMSAFERATKERKAVASLRASAIALQGLVSPVSRQRLVCLLGEWRQ